MSFRSILKILKVIIAMSSKMFVVSRKTEIKPQILSKI